MDAVSKSGGGVRIMTNPHDIIKKPVVTEQSMAEMADKKYTFVVA